MNDYQKKFGLFLKKSRENVGLTQETAADIIGVSKTTIQKWENEGTKPDDIYLENIMETYQIRRDIFFERYNNLVCPPKEEESNDTVPWPSYMPLQSWLGEEEYNAIKNLSLNSYETMVFGLKYLYDEHIPETFVQEIGVFPTLHIKKELISKVKEHNFENFIYSYLTDKPNKRFHISHLTEKDFYEYAAYLKAENYRLNAPCRRSGTITGYNNATIKDIIDEIVYILKTLEEHDNKYLYFKDDNCVEAPYSKNILFGNKIKYEESIHNINMFQEHVLPLFKDLIMIENTSIVDQMEYDIYKSRLEIYNKYQAIEEPKEPTPQILSYIKPTEQGKKFLKWFKENIEEM